MTIFVPFSASIEHHFRNMEAEFSLTNMDYFEMTDVYNLSPTRSGQNPRLMIHIIELTPIFTHTLSLLKVMKQELANSRVI
jgi:hypothetical protein